jgi:nucleotide-binding universal stress UspA family protein
MDGFHRILCPVDFSDASRHALDHAVGMAKWYGGQVWVHHVHRLSMPVFGVAPFPGPEAVIAVGLSDAERESLQASFRYWVATETGGAPITTILDDDFDVPGAIAEQARRLPADLIVLGTHGRSGFSRLALGSITEKVIRIAPCAVLTVPPRAPDAVPRSIDVYQRIVCPVDFSACSRRALEHALSLARAAHARITVAHIIDIPPDAAAPERPDLEPFRAFYFQQAHRCMDELLGPVRGANAIDELLLAGKPHREILRLAAEQQADAIVMGVQGRGAVDRMLFGSVTAQIVRHAICPVLTVRGV